MEKKIEHQTVERFVCLWGSKSELESEDQRKRECVHVRASRS